MIKDGVDIMHRLSMVDRRWHQSIHEETDVEWRVCRSENENSEGEFKQGWMHGVGRKNVWKKDGGNEIEVEEFGQFQNGRLNGVGRKVIGGNQVIEGVFKNGRLSGTGIMVTSENQEKVQGYFSTNSANETVLSGFGRIMTVLSDGTDYVLKALFENNQATTIGTESTKESYYEGQFNSSMKHGVGKLTYNDGKSYLVGYFDCGNLAKYYIKRNQDGTLFEGDLESPENRQGRSFRIESNLKRFIGTGKIAQIESQLNPVTEVFKGEVDNVSLLPHGKGILASEGTIYKGHFENGVKQGRGLLIRKSEGDLLIGDWDQDNIVGRVIQITKWNAQIRVGTIELGRFKESAQMQAASKAELDIERQFSHFESEINKQIKATEDYLKIQTMQLVSKYGSLKMASIQVAERMLEADIRSITTMISNISEKFKKQSSSYNQRHPGSTQENVFHERSQNHQASYLRDQQDANDYQTPELNVQQTINSRLHFGERNNTTSHLEMSMFSFNESRKQQTPEDRHNGPVLDSFIEGYLQNMDSRKEGSPKRSPNQKNNSPGNLLGNDDISLIGGSFEGMRREEQDLINEYYFMIDDDGRNMANVSYNKQDDLQNLEEIVELQHSLNSAPEVNDLSILEAYRKAFNIEVDRNGTKLQEVNNNEMKQPKTPHKNVKIRPDVKTDYEDTFSRVRPLNVEYHTKQIQKKTVSSILRNENYNQVSAGVRKSSSSIKSRPRSPSMNNKATNIDEKLKTVSFLDIPKSLNDSSLNMVNVNRQTQNQRVASSQSPQSPPRRVTPSRATPKTSSFINSLKLPLSSEEDPAFTSPYVQQPFSSRPLPPAPDFRPKAPRLSEGKRRSPY